MLVWYYYFLQYRLDIVLAALLALTACLATRAYIRWRTTRSQTLAKGTWLAAAFIMLVGGLVSEWIGRDRSERLVTLFSAFGPTYAAELSRHHHDLVTLGTPGNDPHYLELIELQKEWMKVNSLMASIYTFRRDDQGRIYFVVGAETDYDHNGRYEGDREQRLAIGELYATATPKFFSALDGRPEFESAILSDRWGIWVSSFTPIYDQQGKVEAAVGIDYPADLWLQIIGTIRRICLMVAMAFIALLLVSSAILTLLRGEVLKRHAALLRMEQARESALEASAAKSEFLAITSHEVRNPLTAILGFASMLSTTQLDATQRRYVETMNHAGRSLMDLLNGILDYTRIESGKVELERVPWAPAMLIHEVIGTMSARAEEKGVALNFDNQLPGNLTLKGDTTRIRQILLNLLGNALKFTATGSVTVRAGWTQATGQSETGRMVVSVIDTGIGIPADKIPHLFKAFSQVDASTTRTHGGSGLGLAISKRLTDMMGGSLTVQSTPGKGSEFTLALDCTMVPASAVRTAAGTGSRATADSFTGRALVVDDERLNRELLNVMLRRCGMEVDLAASGHEAIALAARNSYAIILSDLEMPDMDGFTTAQSIRAAEPPGCRVPILAISALTAKGTRERCLAAGMDDYLVKPVYPPALYSTLAALLSQGGGFTPIQPVQ